MGNVVAKMADNLLNPNAPLFKILRDNPPAWWEMLKRDSDLYIDIRKNDKIMIYYQGGRVACLTYDQDTGKLSATIHPKYLGYTDKTNDKYYETDSERPIYQDIENDICPQLIKSIKSNIEEYYSKKGSSKKSEEDIQEKLIQGKRVIECLGVSHIDSEFAHRQYDGKTNMIRIDLVHIENHEIVFEELKKVTDPRLRTLDGNPEILTQMNSYEEFITENAEVLLEYYKTLLMIKERLGLPVPRIEDPNLLKVRKKPRLIIYDTYTKETTARKVRILDIERILSGYDKTIIPYKK